MVESKQDEQMGRALEGYREVVGVIVKIRDARIKAVLARRCVM